jgi:hypothetical protein
MLIGDHVDKRYNTYSSIMPMANKVMSLNSTHPMTGIMTPELVKSRTHETIRRKKKRKKNTQTQRRTV